VSGEGRSSVLRFLGEDHRSEGLIPAGVRTVRGEMASAPLERRNTFRPRISVRSFRRQGRNGDGGGVGDDLVSERWSPAQELQHELDRSRRFGHPFALLGIWCRPKQRERWTFLREVAGSLNELVRRVDCVWIQGSGVYVLLPECDRTKLEATLDRLRGPMARLLGDDARAEMSAVVFPDDGLTTGALFSALDDNRGSLADDRPKEGTPAA
jgi:hypothetical protein